MKRLAILLLGLLVAVPTTQAADPLKSVMWEFVRNKELQVESVTFDDRIRVYAPKSVEDGMNVPVSVKVEGIDNIEQIVVLADHNPIHRALNYYPDKAEPYIAFRIKVQESTPIRAAVKTTDGRWLVGGVWLEAPGGGCTTPSETQASRAWEDHLNQLAGRVWQNSNGVNRLRMRIIHPMDTGLTGNIPAFYLEKLEVQNMSGKVLARLETFEPISENPVFSFSIPEVLSQDGYKLVGRDNNGNELDASVSMVSN